MQLRKAIWRTIRDRLPCSRCGQEHKTREHGKSAKLIAAENRSRELNHQDPINDLPYRKLLIAQPSGEPLTINTLMKAFKAIVSETDAEYARGEALDSL